MKAIGKRWRSQTRSRHRPEVCDKGKYRRREQGTKSHGVHFGRFSNTSFTTGIAEKTFGQPT
jgi:hypothetical protein